MAVIFKKRPNKTELQKFAFEWMQAIADKDYELALSMTHQRDWKYTAKKLKKVIEDAIEFNEAVAVKLPSKKAFLETVGIDYHDSDLDGVKTKKKKADFEWVGSVLFQFCVDGEIVDETVDMRLHQDKDGFSLEFIDMHVL